MHRFALILFVCSLTGCSQTHAASEADDIKAWQGTWKLVSCTAGGESQMADMQWIVQGDHYKVRLDKKTGADPYSITLNPGQKQIDVFHHDTPAGTYGGKLKGIYEIQGNSLKVCYDLKGQQYPTSFDAGQDSGRVVYQFQRQ